MKRIGVLTSGGDAPGMNSALRAVVRTAIYYDIEVFGVQRGYQGLIEGDLKQLHKSDVANILHRGGTVLKTARSTDFMQTEGRAKAFATLKENNIEGLIVIGGNGSYTGAMYLAQEHGVKVIGIPGTIDNDIYGTDYTIGFDTAVNTAVDSVDKIRDTADSHSRLFLIEVMGRHSGYIGLFTAIGSGASGLFIPEHDTTLEEFVKQLKKDSRRNKLFNLVIVAEGNTLGPVSDLAKKVREMDPSQDVRTAVIGHLQRGGAPTASDRVLSSRLAYAAVQGLLEEKSEVAVGIINHDVVYTPIMDAISKKKVPDNYLIKMAEILSL